MAIAKTKLINISANVNSMNLVLSKFINLKGIHPVEASQIVDKTRGLTIMNTDNPYVNILNKIDNIEKSLSLHVEISCNESYEEEDNFSDYVKNLDGGIVEKIALIDELKNTISKYEETYTQLTHIENINIPFDDLFNTKYVDVRLGKIPIDSAERLSYYKTKPVIFKVLDSDNEYCWILYFTTKAYKQEIDNLFSSLFFQRVFIPDFVHGYPNGAKEELLSKINLMKTECAGLEEELKTLGSKEYDNLCAIKNKVIYLSNIFEAKKYVVGMKDRFSISLFALEKDVNNVKNVFEDLDEVIVEVGPPNSDKRIKPPTKLKNNWFTAPFSMFVEMYGVPEYGGFDPTPIVAITYSLLFGIMFGDLGQGFVMVIIGLLLSKFKKMKLGGVIARIGIASMIFGLIYGSVFGYENLLDPMYQALGLAGKPIDIMDSTMTMNLIIGTIGLGALLIVISMIINVIDNAKKKKFARMLFSNNGIAGLIFYSFVLVAIVLRLTNIANVLTPAFIIPFAVLPLILIFFKEPLERKFAGRKMFESGFLGFFVEGFFELFEVVLSYITGTVSFMRVGGFIISHAGMMLVVHTLMDMVGGAGGSIIVAIIGNIFVMGLEGLVVGIQCLRLEFYEMFSRYYDGGGVAFKSININNKR